MQSLFQKKYGKTLKVVMIYFTFFLWGNIAVYAQPSFEWAKKIGSTNSEYGYSICNDASGNSYTLGHFTNTIDFDPGVGTANLTSNGGDDIYIIKLDVLGNFVWAKKIGGTQSDYGNSIALDLSGNIYITGTFRGTVDFNPNAGVNNLTASGTTDSYILKLSASGNFVWASRFGGVSGVGAFNIVIDNSNNVLITGTYGGTVDFNPEAGVFNLTSAGLNDLFAVKLNASGNFVWAKSWGGISNDFGSIFIRTDTNEDIYCTGYFSNTVDFDPSASTVNLTSSGQTDIFILKLSSAGNFVWAKQVGGSLGDECISANIDINNDLYLTGTFQGTVDFNPNAGTSNLTASVQDIFVLKLDMNGNYVWAKNMGGAVHSGSYAITTDLSGDVYVTGYFQGTVDFNPNAGVNNFTSFGGADIFILKLDAMGNYVWAIQKGGTNSEEPYSISVDANYNIYTTGYFQGTADFDAGTGTFNLVSSGGYDIYIDKTTQCIVPSQPINTTPSINQTICANTSTTLSVTSTGTVDWYTTSSSSTSVGSGTNFTTPVLVPGTYTYYAEAVTCTTSTTRTEIIVTVNSTITGSQTLALCAGQSVTVGTNTYTASGIYTDVLTAMNGCDSTVTTNLTVDPAITGSQTLTLCAGQSVTVGSNTYNTSGVYTDVLSAMNGCDSTVTTNLIVNPAITGSQTLTLCAGQFVTVGSNTYNTSGVYTDVLSAMNGCDSTVTTNLTVDPAITGSQTLTLCAGQSVTVGSNTYNTSGVYTDVLSAMNGCDSTVTTNLIINNVIDITTSLSGLTISANESGASYQWIDCDNSNAVISGETNQNFTALSNGNYAVIVTLNTCLDTSLCVNVTGVGITKSPDNDFLTVYPNPFSTHTTLVTSNVLSNATMIVYNSFRQQVKQIQNISSQTITFYRDDLPSGVYFIRLMQDADEIATRKVVIAD